MNGTFKSFFNGDVGNRSEDFYFKYNAKGAKYFYSKITGKRIAKEIIPAQFHAKIQPYNSELDVGNLLLLRKGYQAEIEKLQMKIAEIDLKVSKASVTDEAGLQKKKEEEDVKIRKRREEYKVEREREQEELLGKLFEYCAKAEAQSEPRAKTVPKSKVDISILEQYNITTQKEWRKWLIKHHPDKGGDEELCKRIIAAGRAKGW